MNYDHGEATPETAEEIRELAVWFKAKRFDGTEDDLALFCGYLTENCGLKRELVRDALADVWPEASAQVARWME